MSIESRASAIVSSCDQYVKLFKDQCDSISNKVTKIHTEILRTAKADLSDQNKPQTILHEKIFKLRSAFDFNVALYSSLHEIQERFLSIQKERPLSASTFLQGRLRTFINQDVQTANKQLSKAQEIMMSTLRAIRQQGVDYEKRKSAGNKEIPADYKAEDLGLEKIVQPIFDALYSPKIENEPQQDSSTLRNEVEMSSEISVIIEEEKS